LRVTEALDAATADEPATYGHGPGLIAIAHRGGAALGPENTHEAFQRAVDMGYRYLETDVRMSSDGVCVAFHDRSLRRVTGTPGSIGSATWPQLQQLVVLNRGRIPRVDDLLRAWPDVHWMLDVKEPAALPALVEIVSEARAAHRICLGGTWDSVLAQARAHLGPQVSTALGWRSVTALLTGTPHRVGAATFAHIPLHLGARRLPTPRLLERARERGLRVIVWGAATGPEMQRLIDEGVDGIITDRTDLLRDALVAHGEWRKRGSNHLRAMQTGGGLRALGQAANPVHAAEV
jgi:glycerophosphoryl diester phosphodiesterase